MQKKIQEKKLMLPSEKWSCPENCKLSQRQSQPQSLQVRPWQLTFISFHAISHIPLWQPMAQPEPRDHTQTQQVSFTTPFSKNLFRRAPDSLLKMTMMQLTAPTLRISRMTGSNLKEKNLWKHINTPSCQIWAQHEVGLARAQSRPWRENCLGGRDWFEQGHEQESLLLQPAVACRGLPCSQAFNIQPSSGLDGLSNHASKNETRSGAANDKGQWQRWAAH